MATSSFDVPSVRYHCPCQSSDPIIYHPSLPSSSPHFHDLHDLYFCEECDAIRCDRCVQVEISCYYCPHCLFEVPNASVRAELNRCARNCFLCPHCTNALVVNSTDPLPSPAQPSTSSSQMPPPPTPSTPSDPSFYLYCNFCRWSSAEAGITFDKPTGVALQLQKMEDQTPDTLELERLKDHFEPFLRSAAAASSSSSSHPGSSSNPSSSILAASSALHRDVPSLRNKPRYSGGSRVPSGRSGGPSKDAGGVKDGDSVPPYRARGEARVEGSVSGPGGLAEDDKLGWLGAVDTLEGVADLERRWGGGWSQSVRAIDLKPPRTPLHSKKTKRCSECRHILIKPEQKAQSVRYKIKLLAASYLPTIEIARRLPTDPRLGGGTGRRPGSSRMSVLPVAATPMVEGDGLRRGASYSYRLAFTNPLFDPINITLSILPPVPLVLSSTKPNSTQASLDPASPYSSSPTPTTSAAKPPFQITLPLTTFPVSAFADPWEYGDDEDDIDSLLEGTPAAELSGTKGRGSTMRKKEAVVLLERRGNVTEVGMEVKVGSGKEGVLVRGDLDFTLRVLYTYKSEDPADATETTKKGGKGKDGEKEEEDSSTKEFTFETMVHLGRVVEE